MPDDTRELIDIATFTHVLVAAGVGVFTAAAAPFRPNASTFSRRGGVLPALFGG